jgi:hypothetical protein
VTLKQAEFRVDFNEVMSGRANVDDDDDAEKSKGQGTPATVVNGFFCLSLALIVCLSNMS